MQRVAELRVGFLAPRRFGEVHLELEADGEPLRLRGEIADRDVLQQSDRDAPLTHHQEVVVAQPVRERIPEEEGRPVRDVVTAGEELRRSVVEGEDEARKVTRIAGEEPECALAQTSPGRPRCRSPSRREQSAPSTEQHRRRPRLHQALAQRVAPASRPSTTPKSRCRQVAWA